MDIEIPSRLAVLGHPQRLAVFRLLMRRYPGKVPATEIAHALEIKPNTLSTYLGALLRAGLIAQTRKGTSLLYAIEMEAVRATFDHLLLDCCQGRPDACSQFWEPTLRRTPEGRDTKRNVLFLCSGNSARSILAEGILRRVGGDRFNAYSAGTAPRAEVHPVTLRVLAQRGCDTSGLSSKSIQTFRGWEAPVFDFVFSVCDDAANRDASAWPGPPVRAHWGLNDPAGAGRTEDEMNAAFQEAYDLLFSRIEAFASLPLATLNRGDTQQAVDRIGQAALSEIS